MPLNKDIKKVLVIGSGPIVIGQAAEFDYAGAQACRVLKDEGIEVVLVNSNPATIMTDKALADHIYLEPLTEETVKRIIEKEHPDSILCGLGGQTGLTIGMQLAKDGYLDEMGVKLLGTDAEAIDKAEDRQMFRDTMIKINQPVVPSDIAYTVDHAKEIASDIGYPVIIRPAFTLGGAGGGVAYNEHELEVIAKNGLMLSPITQVLVERYIAGWKEIEFEVMRDSVGNVIAVCSMENFDPVGVHTGDSIVIAPAVTLADKELQMLRSASLDIITELGIEGGCNCQFALNPESFEYSVIEVNPRASRTIPYISKVTGVPMVELATKIMVGQKLKDLGFGTGLYKTPPYVAVKVPVFSFEKLNDVNSKLGPEMKSTGEVLGVGKNLVEALFKGLVSAGFKTDFHSKDEHGVLITVTKQDRFEIVGLAKKLDDLGAKIWATPETAKAIESLGIKVNVVNKLREDNSIMDLVESGQLDYIVYTGKSDKKSIADYIKLHNRANQLGIATITSLDTANAVADIIASRYKETNTELVDINFMRKEKGILKFSKMQGTGDDYIFFNNQCGIITCPESFAIEFCDRHKGIGGDGIVLIEESKIANAKMRVFNLDGSEGKMAGNSIRCVGKFLYDNDIVKKDKITIETASGVKVLRLFTRDGKVSSVKVSMGKAELNTAKIPVLIDSEKAINYPAEIGSKQYNITCCAVGNPHCVVFVDNVDRIDIESVGPQFETAPIFPERVNTEFVRVVNSKTLKMRVWERGNGETQACGTGACAAVIAAVENGYCNKDEDIIVKVKGGDLIVNYSDTGVTLTGDCNLVYKGEIEY